MAALVTTPRIDPVLVEASARPPARNPVLVYLATLGSKHSRRAMETALKRLLRTIGSELAPADFPWERIDYEHAVAFRAALVQAAKPSAINQSLAALKGVLEQAYLLRLLDADTLTRIQRGVKGVKIQRGVKGRHVPDEETSAMLAICDRSDPLGIRDAALIAFLCTTGCRRTELCGVEHPRDVDRRTGEVVVTGKGDKKRFVFLGDAMVEIDAWLEVRGDAPGKLFWGQKLNEEWDTRGLTEGGVYTTLQRVAEAAGVDPWPRPHDYRRTLIGKLFSMGIDPATIKAIVGHENLNTTVQYDRRGIDLGRDAIAKLRIPR